MSLSVQIFNLIETLKATKGSNAKKDLVLEFIKQEPQETQLSEFVQSVYARNVNLYQSKIDESLYSPNSLHLHFHGDY